MYMRCVVTFSSDVQTNVRSVAQTMLERMRKLLCVCTDRGSSQAWGGAGVGGGEGVESGDLRLGFLVVVVNRKLPRGQSGIRV